MSDIPPTRGARQWILLIVGIIAFGCLMGVRETFEPIWLRAIIAACAFATFAASVAYFRKRTA